MSTRHHGNRTTAGRTLLAVLWWIPPALLGAMLVAGPVSASGGTPAVVAAAAHQRAGPALTAGAATASPCAVVISPLPRIQSAGPAGAPDGSGSCLAPADPSAPRDGATSIAPNTQAVTQSIGLEVRPG